MMGMTNLVYWVNTLGIGLSIGLPLCLISTIQIVMPMYKVPLLNFSSPTIVFTTLLFFVIGTLLIVLLITVIFNSSTLLRFEHRLGLSSARVLA